jgi:nucleoside-diphosphate-sugar epimerase
VAAVASDVTGVLNVVDDEPAPVSAWLPALAEAAGAKPPLRVPKLVARVAAGAFAVQVATEQRGASGARAKERLGWSPAHPSWREGFRASLATMGG